MSNVPPMADVAKNDKTHKCLSEPEKKIQMRKKTAKELEEMATAIPPANRVTSCESTEETEPRAPIACVSETSLQKLNAQLKIVPMVKAFDKAENKITNPPK